MTAKVFDNSIIVEEEDRDSEDEQEKPKEYDSWWHVNKSGFPICEETWEKMWRYVESVHPDGTEVARRIRGQNVKKACS